MQVTAEMILTDFGAILPLTRRRRDALADYARKAAAFAGARSAQRWAEKTWGLRDYEAKDLLKGNASEAVWERIQAHPNGGWSVTIPVMGAVIGKSLEDYVQDALRREREEMERDQQRHAARAAEMAGIYRALHRPRVVAGSGDRLAASKGRGDVG